MHADRCPGEASAGRAEARKEYTMTAITTPRRLLALAAAVLVIGAVCAFALMTRAWAEEHRGGERLLPGTVVAGVEVGELTVGQATDAVAAELDQRLDADLTIEAPEARWVTSPRQLGARADAAAAVAEAVDASTTTGWSDLVAMRWLDSEGRIDVATGLEPDTDRVATEVAGYAADIDGEPVAASARWAGGSVEVVPDQTGRSLDRPAAEQAIAQAITEGSPVVELPVDETPASIVRDEVEAVTGALDAAAKQTLDRAVTLVHDDATWELTPRDVGARPRIEESVSTAVALYDEDPDAVAEELGLVSLDIDADAVDAELGAIAEAVAVEPVNADIDYSTGWVQLTGSAEGLALDRDTARDATVDALHGEQDTVELPTSAVAPARTRADFRDVLLVRLDERRLYHYRDGEIADDWPVAIGTSEQPTPTGRFTIGQKRHMPTWHNPATDRWGSDMPEVVEPGPDNPLGVRAMNWNQGGADTLIRFHGTSHTSSIGEASSNGCVRLTNDDVIDLYDRIPSGTPVVSVHG